MTREEIKAKLQFKLRKARNKQVSNYNYYKGMEVGIIQCLSLIGMLDKVEKGQPQLPSDLEEATKLLADIIFEAAKGGYMNFNTDEERCAMNIARENVVKFISLLNKPQLPSDVEEAAEKFANSYDMGTCDGVAQDCFKAEAEWAMGQFELVYEGNGAIPDESGGYRPTEVKLYRKND